MSTELPEHMDNPNDLGPLALVSTEGLGAGSEARCWCHACIKAHDIRGPFGLPLSVSMMVLCPDCGNKRCPHANDHRNACTGSNEPGQPGSAYT